MTHIVFHAHTPLARLQALIVSQYLPQQFTSLSTTGLGTIFISLGCTEQVCRLMPQLPAHFLQAMLVPLLCKFVLSTLIMLVQS